MNNIALKYNRSINSYLFILPTYILFILFVLIPLFQAFDISFQKYNILGNSKYIGFKNYLKLFDDSRLIVMYSNTIFFTFFAVIFNTGIGLLLAVMLNQRMPNLVRNLYRSIFFFPLLLAHAYIAIIWKFLYQKDTGAFNYYITNFGFDPIPWLNSAEWVLPSIIIMDVWKNTGFAMLIFLAGLQNIPKDVIEASVIDGANKFKIFIFIKLPLLTPTILFILVVFMIGAFQVFDSIVVLTNGGPGDASRSVTMYIYHLAFEKFDMGYASAVSMTLFLIILLLTIFQFWLSKKWVHYE